jgi:hypothetical protein
MKQEGQKKLSPVLSGNELPSIGPVRRSLLEEKKNVKYIPSIISPSL